MNDLFHDELLIRSVWAKRDSAGKEMCKRVLSGYIKDFQRRIQMRPEANHRRVYSARDWYCYCMRKS